MQFLFHADDFGLSAGINKSILECADAGMLDSVSIISNGYAVEEAIREYQARPDLKLSVHLNFLEGKALSEIPALTDKDGYFNRSFFNWLALDALLTGKKREEMKSDIISEIYRQVWKITPYLHPGAELRIDSHQHVHMIPLFFDSLMEVSQQLKIRYIRIPSDRFFIPQDPKLRKQALGINYFKLRLLRHLAHANIGKIPSYVRWNEDFMGVLFTGKMSASAIRERLAKWPEQKEKEGITEILFHPGSAVKGEEDFWKKYASLKDYYFSGDRQNEKKELLSPELRLVKEELHSAV